MALKIPFLHRENTTANGTEKSNAAPFSLKLYRLSYFTGRYAIRVFHAAGRAFGTIFNIALSEIVGKAGDAARYISEFQRSRAGRGEISLARGFIDASRGLSNTLQVCLAAVHRGGILSGFTVAGRIIRRSVARSFATKRSALNYLAPLAGIAVLAFTVYFWNTSCLAISVKYGGKNLGVVASEQTFRDAAAQVEENVSDASGSNFKLNRTISIKMVLAKRTDLSDEDQIYNNIIMMSSSEVQSGYGLYVDNRLAGANPNSTAIEAMLNDMTSKYANDPNVQSVGFVQNVSIKNGVFPGSVFKSIADLKNVVTANNKTSGGVVSARVPDMFRISLDPLYAMNLADGESVDQNDIVVTGTSQPTLTVKVVKNEVYTQPIAYSVEQVASAALKSGTKQISVSGKNGVKKIVAAVTYVDGVKTDESVLTSAITVQPIAQKILIGTKKIIQSIYSSDGYYSGSDYSGGDPASGNPSTVGGLIGYAEGKIGIAYVPGGSSTSGFDCSGFTSYVFSKYGISLPHSAAEQSAYGSPVSRSSLQAGDLVFFDTNGGHNSITHVGIYIGGGSFIDASSARPHSVTIDSLNSNYYTQRYMTARRVVK